MLELFDLLFPTQCLGCRSYGVLLCQKCRVYILDQPVMQICIGCQRQSLFGWTCGPCLKKNPSLPERVLSATNYQQPIPSKLIGTLKYIGVKNLAEPCAELLMEFIYSKLSKATLGAIQQDFNVCYVPMHKNKQVSRGFNQSELIADYLARRLDIPLLHLLSKIRKTKAQMGLNKVQRISNVTAAFDSASCEGKNILLIDDVVTTGSTLIQCVKELKTSGAKTVWCLVLAKD